MLGPQPGHHVNSHEASSLSEKGQGKPESQSESPEMGHRAQDAGEVAAKCLLTAVPTPALTFLSGCGSQEPGDSSVPHSFPPPQDQELIKPALGSTGLHLTQSMRSFACWMFTQWASIEPGL